MSETLVDALEAQHRALEKAVGEVQAAYAAGHAANVGAKVSAMRKLLEGHLALENTQLYPKIVEMAAGRQNMLELAKLFQTNMATIAEGLVQFFERFEGQAVDLEAFGPEWKTIVETLTARIKQEEATLHPMFRRLSRMSGVHA
ncbi:MAG: hemerythrin domain-containing protein [Myxococcaceae bacterium]|nr:hemerythrin domain-containing protein [Myxococcaceae bacterium]